MDRLAGVDFTDDMNSLNRTLTIVAAVGAAASGGVFLAFSTFVMKALGRLPTRDGMVAMQAINRAAPNPVFMITLFGTGAACVVLIVTAVRNPEEPWSTRVLAGAGSFLVCVVLTVAYHVPRNDALAAANPDTAAGMAMWGGYLRNWTRWNHVRTVSALAGAVGLTLGLTTS